MTMTRLVVTAALAAASLVAVHDAQAAPAGGYGWLPDSAALAAPVLADGVLRTAGGALAGHRPVVLLAWPANDVLARLRVGDSVGLRPVSRATTDAAGRYALKLADLAALAPVTAADGLVNFELISATPTDVASWSFGARVVGAHGVPALVDAGGAGRLVAHAPELRAAVHRTARTVAADAVSRQAGCTSRLEQDLGLHKAVGGQTTSTTTGVTHRFIYGRSATSQLGVGLSGDGKVGSWKRNGTEAKASAGSQSYTAQGSTTAMRYLVQWRFAKFYVSCYDPASYVTVSRYEARTTSWTGGTFYQRVGYPGASWCVPESKGATFTQSSTKQHTFETGYAVKGVLGIDLSAQTGFSSTAEVSFDFVGASRRLCGSADYPGAGGPSQLVAKA